MKIELSADEHGSEAGKRAPDPSSRSLATQDALDEMSRKRRAEHRSRLSELDKLSDTIQHGGAMTIEERQRQMNIIYSRRKRVRQSQRVDDLTERCVSYREDNQRLRTENEHLETMLLKAHELAKRIETSNGFEVAQQGPLAPSRSDQDSFRSGHRLLQNANTSMLPLSSSLHTQRPVSENQMWTHSNSQQLASGNAIDLDLWNQRHVLNSSWKPQQINLKWNSPSIPLGNGLLQEQQQLFHKSSNGLQDGMTKKNLSAPLNNDLQYLPRFAARSLPLDMQRIRENLTVQLSPMGSEQTGLPLNTELQRSMMALLDQLPRAEKRSGQGFD